jgi:hypothetical protein
MDGDAAVRFVDSFVAAIVGILSDAEDNVTVGKEPLKPYFSRSCASEYAFSASKSGALTEHACVI